MSDIEMAILQGAFAQRREDAIEECVKALRKERKQWADGANDWCRGHIDALDDAIAALRAMKGSPHG